ncbi:MAG TPA: helix-turn-helix domain-containing protein, partial [Arenibaculum sp.]|nr:helix-turn-helix domain-containing protein [Arenibaculum sp.]
MSAKPRIERAALEVFVRAGVDAATTRAIAAQAGCSEGALYRHWKSKDELALSLFMGVHRRL